MIAAFSVIRFDVTIQTILFCVFDELVISKMLFHFECFLTQWARNIIFNVPVMSLLGWVSVFWDLNSLPHIFQTKSQIIIANFGSFSYFDPIQASVCLILDWLQSCVLKLSLFWWPEQPIKCQALKEISGWVFFFRISKVWKGRELLKIWVT